MDLQALLTVNKYFEFVWTSQPEKLRELFAEDIQQKRVTPQMEILSEQKGRDALMAEYQQKFFVVDLSSTRVYDLALKGNNLIIIASYQFYQEKTGEKANFKVKQTFECTPDGKIRQINMVVKKTEI